MQIRNFFGHTKQNLVVNYGDRKLAIEIFLSFILWRLNLFLGAMDNRGQPKYNENFPYVSPNRHDKQI
jgi:hypothetical protein